MGKAMAMGMSEGKPRLRITAHVDSYGEPTIDDKKWLQEDIDRSEKKVKHMKKAVKNWDGKAVADEAFRSLSEDLEMELSYLAERKRKLKKRVEPRRRGLKI